MRARACFVMRAVEWCQKSGRNESQCPFEITFEEVPVGQGRIDLIVAKQIVVELKAVDRLRDVHYAQLKSYLRATSHRVGLLFNFNAPTLTTKRMVLD
ncbi:MAG: hypothetical protein QOK27_291 [Gemmatimonadales bacterium]|jgi:GxxExxY protein|nr:hypothetical protein [Gemmatimonadales bacterium]